MPSQRCKVMERGVGPYGAFICPRPASQYVLGTRPGQPNYKLPVCDEHAKDWMVEHREPIEDEYDPRTPF